MDHVVSLGENLRCNIIINGEYKEEIIWNINYSVLIIFWLFI
jgi:hypothetical protein